MHHLAPVNPCVSGAKNSAVRKRELSPRRTSFISQGRMQSKATCQYILHQKVLSGQKKLSRIRGRGWLLNMGRPPQQREQLRSNYVGLPFSVTRYYFSISSNNGFFFILEKVLLKLGLCGFFVIFKRVLHTRVGVIASTVFFKEILLSTTMV